MNCEIHPDREARLSPYDWKRCCDECFQKQIAERQVRTPFKGKREAWELEDDYRKNGENYSVQDTSGQYRSLHPDERIWK